MTTDQLQEVVSVVLNLLAKEEYSQLERLTHGMRLSSEQIKEVVTDYGRKLITAPDSAFELMSVIRVRDTEPPQWSIAMPLWTQEEGRSDLSMELTVLEQEDGYKIELDNLHVL
jgi:hypothetical protein